jgi:hypothetical protein
LHLEELLVQPLHLLLLLPLLPPLPIVPAAHVLQHAALLHPLWGGSVQHTHQWLCTLGAQARISPHMQYQCRAA